MHRLTSTTSDRSDEGFSLPLIVIKWRKRQKLHNRICHRVVGTVCVSVVALLQDTVMGHNGTTPIQFIYYNTSQITVVDLNVTFLSLIFAVLTLNIE